VIDAGNVPSASYFGTYTVNDADKSMTMHIDAGSGAHASGSDEKRAITLNGDELIVEDRSPAAAGKLTWQRSN